MTNFKTSNKKTSNPDHKGSVLADYNEKTVIGNDGKIIYTEHDPFCVIYQLGPGHCNCVDYDQLDSLMPEEEK